MGYNVIKAARRYHVEPRGVVHVGAHLGQEYRSYVKHGVRRQVWIEPQPDVYARLLAALPGDDDVVAIEAACGAERGRAIMHRLQGNEGASNSLLEAGEALRAFLPPVDDARAGGALEVEVVPLDELLPRHGLDASRYNVLVLDVQGYELECLRGAERFVGEHVECIGCEVSTAEVYVGGSLVGEIDAFLERRGFVRTETWLDGHHGDAVYVRRVRLGPWQRLRYRLRGSRVHRSRRPG